MAKYYLIEANEVPTTMMERIQNEGTKPVKFTCERKGFFGTRVIEKTMMVAWNWNHKSLAKGCEVVFP
jgi:hypothetical protein